MIDLHSEKRLFSAVVERAFLDIADYLKQPVPTRQSRANFQSAYEWIIEKDSDSEDMLNLFMSFSSLCEILGFPREQIEQRIAHMVDRNSDDFTGKGSRVIIRRHDRYGYAEERDLDCVRFELQAPLLHDFPNRSRIS